MALSPNWPRPDWPFPVCPDGAGHPQGRPGPEALPPLARAAWSGPGAASRPQDPALAQRPRPWPGYVVERVTPTVAATHQVAWADLAARALEPNVFLDPDFALPAARHLGAGGRVAFLLVWAGAGRGAGDLVAVCAVADRIGPLKALASAWLHDLSTLGFPLLDRERAAGALAALLHWAGTGLAGAQGLMVRAVPSGGPTADALRAVSVALDLDLVVLESWRRAVLPRGAGRAGLAALSAKAAKDLRRQRRRLAEQGPLVYETAWEGEPLRAAVERFLALEASGWKGKAGTALLVRPAQTAFVRTATRLLAQRGLCRVDSLMQGDTPLAMALVLRAGDTAFLWKIAYREAAARFSPGVQLVLHLTEAQLGDETLAATDSCAVPRHPMIDRLWRDRMDLADVVVQTRPGRRLGFALAVAGERAARRLRAAAKRLARSWRMRGEPAGPEEA